MARGLELLQSASLSRFAAILPKSNETVKLFHRKLDCWVALIGDCRPEMGGLENKLLLVSPSKGLPSPFEMRGPNYKLGAPRTGIASLDSVKLQWRMYDLSYQSLHRLRRRVRTEAG